MEEKMDPEAFYHSQCTAYTQEKEKLRKKIYAVGTLRLVVIVTGLLTLWLYREKSWEILSGIAVTFLLPFAGLVIYHSKLFARKAYSEGMIRLNMEELNGLAYDFSAFDGAPEQIDGQHSFSLDLDLFGKRSLFQSVNRTATSMGREGLIKSFIHPPDKKETILRRQEAIRELAGKAAFRHAFRVSGLLAADEKKRPEQLAPFLAEPSRLAGRIGWKILIWSIPGLWVLLLSAYAFSWVTGNELGLFFAISFLVANSPAKQINKLHHQVGKMEKLFSAYANLMSLLENESFASPLLKEMQEPLSGAQGKASSAIKKLSSYLGALDQRFSLAGILFNIFYLRDTRQAIRLEKWKEIHAADTQRWFDSLAGFDALNSLGTFAFNHPDYIYPEIADHYFRMEGKSLGHPLIQRDKCVRNDIDIHQSPSFLIITGANMAGKSTYLRTVGVNFLLGCLGAPACAEALTLYPAHLVTSLRTADSLASNESYFFAELKRLKMIIDRLEKGEELFIILDEILKGTNSIDKQKGSIALMKQLVVWKACGIIATHDLALGNLEKEFPGHIRNYRFEADITNDELTFSYRLRKGIAQNMNASFLMKKMGITLE
ncbi:MutS family DNA mismatch repair protein [Parabacteroides sp. Marseille-P3160]|uniref:MutS family DNA mismatch repair protein n=1 Tax=Parabacteroides sp. Marseille-P3160 TaxID=1917887 RepID=UPI0009B9F7E4|nr:MutS family DNA mismatch repair protein [Parabacteroides sp. Marseille-P3160]